MPVEVLSGAVIAHGGARVSVAARDLHVAQVDAGIEHGGDEGVPQHMRVDPRQVHSGDVGQAAQADGWRSAGPCGCRGGCAGSDPCSGRCGRYRWRG